jgi:hypothetical protein
MAKRNLGSKEPGAFFRVQEEVNEGHSTRIHLYDELQDDNSLVLCFFVSFRFPAVIEDQDGDVIEELLQNRPSGKHLKLILNSPGGLALPAERIVNICRSYSRDGRFSVIVPKMAKSAATMVCFGAAEIGMSPTSELGPIDPQIPVYDDKGKLSYLAAHEILESYNDLLRQANRTKGRIEPYLQQLARYDAREIRRTVSAQQLSERIAIKTLQTGMLSGKSEAQIKSMIGPFLDPRYTVVHGRPIYPDVAKKAGLAIKLHDLKSEEWRTIWHLYVRLNHYVSNKVAKVIECIDDSFAAPVIMA